MKTLLDRIEALKKVTLFEDLITNTAALEAISSKMTERTFKTGDDIIEEGKAGSELFILISGEVAVFKSTLEGDPYKVVILKSTHYPCFGEGGLLDSDTRSATIRAQSESHCLVLSREIFDQLAQASPAWALPVLRRISQAVLGRLKKTNHDLMLLHQALISEIRGE